MKRFILIILLFPVTVFSQTVNHKYFISFTDKNNSNYSVATPSAFLSSRAIARRTTRNIPIIIQDLPVNESYIFGVENLGARVITKSKWFNGITVECDSVVLAQLQSLPYVNNSSRVFRKGNNSFHKNLSPGAPLNRKSLLRIAGFDYGDSFNQIHLMNGEYLHDLGYKGEGMLIAMIDDGFYSVDVLAPFDSLRSRNNIIATWDFVNDDEFVYDDDTHGMSTLSTIAGNVPGLLVGTAPEASFLLLRSEDVGSEYIIEEYNWDAAAEYADSAGADVISSSLGYTTFGDSTTDHVYADLDGNHAPATIAADIASAKGMLVVLSAGNSGNNPWHYISAPADADSAITVGAVDSSGNYVSFSSYGPSADGDIKPNVAAKGFDCVIADAAGGVGRGNGTSFACPILAGAATCLWQANPHATAQDVRKAIERSANYFLTPTDTLGYGIPDFRVAGFLLEAGDLSLPEKDDLVDIYPNPFAENFQIRFFSSIPQAVNIIVYNMLGETIINEKEFAAGGYINTFSIPAKDLSEGVFIVQLSARETFLRKIVRE